MKVRLPQELQCLRCQHTWTPRKTDVRICPLCKSASWDKPKEDSKGSEYDKSKGSRASNKPTAAKKNKKS